jgi:hypothetical protein
VDTNWYLISAMSAVGLVHDVKLPRADSRIKEILPNAPAMVEATPAPAEQVMSVGAD